MSSTMSSTSYTDQISKPFFKTDSMPKANEHLFFEALSNAQFLKIILDQIQELIERQVRFMFRQNLSKSTLGYLIL